MHQGCSFHFLDWVDTACAGVCSRWRSAYSRRLILLERPRKLRSNRLSNCQLKEQRETFYSFRQLEAPLSIHFEVEISTTCHTCVIGWWRSTTTELIGGATPITWRPPCGTLPTSDRAVMRAVTVFEDFCWPAVTIRAPDWKNMITQLHLEKNIYISMDVAKGETASKCWQ